MRVDTVSDKRVYDIELKGNFYTLEKLVDYNTDSDIYICYDSEGNILEGKNIPTDIITYMYE